jgi:hypothetical protein
MLYFQRMPPTMLATPSLEAQEVIALRERLGRETLYHEFAGKDDLQDLVRTHLVRWLALLRSLHRFQRRYRTNLDLWLTRALNVPNPPPIDEAVSLEQIPWDRELLTGTIEFIPLSFWYDAPRISRDRDRRHDP